ncbi:hypothetical protein Golob_007414 [Gossypium lobatum]|uniref:Uncharacterized protein n=1 Tax=Gossypium lobatum TaxID=34289 RepID=A0A7J8MCK6_9ROSI|nr:hypothetical protein [Gossypium lobatum]
MLGSEMKGLHKPFRLCRFHLHLRRHHWHVTEGVLG